uniref:Reverse transcriptase domain-containing protein n=1 Tax=Tanacetum cinerariifolium TaxID=118510 RepID=A0A6L2KV12_TANCI|nr:reverse transcriptase domain-containing protein [Tanacetum cinerariifolium]
MSTMANTTPIVTTVTKTVNKEKTPKEADAALKANILDFWITLTVEDVLADGALLAETILETETAPMALKNHTQNKYVKDPVEIHNIKQRDGETIEEFIERFKIETGRMKGAPECMRISRFMHGVNNPELTKRLNEHVPKTVEEMMTSTTTFIRGEIPKDGRRSNNFTPITRTPKEIFAAESRKFKPPPPMVTLAKKRSSNKFCEFHNDKGHNTNECVQLRKQIEELVRAGKLSYFIKEIRQDRDQQKTKKGRSSQRQNRSHLYDMAVAESDITEGDTELRSHRRDYAPRWRYFMNTASTRSGQKSRAKWSRRHHWRNGIDKSMNEIMHSLRRKLRYIYMEAVRHDGSTTINCRTSTRYSRRIFPCQTEKKGQALKRAKAIQVEVQKLVEAEILREVYYYDWLSNPAMVRKHDEPGDIRGRLGHQESLGNRAAMGYKRNVPPDTGLFREPSAVSYRAKLYLNGKASPGASLRNQKTSVKSQILADFLFEKPDDDPTEASMIETPQEPWTLFTDGSSCVNGSGAGLIQTSSEGTEFTYVLRFQFIASNNEAEYEALIAGLWIAASREGQVLDSRHGLFHKVDRGKGCGNNYSQSKIGMPTYRTTVVDVVHNDEELRLNLDLLKEGRKRAAIREAEAKLKMTKYCNARVRGVTFRPGHFVYRSNDTSLAVDGGKLGPK